MTAKKLLTPADFREYQPIITSHQLEMERSLTLAGMGLGKGIATLTTLDARIMAGEDAPTLILGPKRVAKTVWVEEAKKWTHTKHLSVVPIMGTEKERLKALKYDAEIYTTNYEQIPWLTDHFGSAWPFKTVVADECFEFGTMIQCDKLSRPIEQLQAGDFVATSDGLKEIIRVIRKRAKEVVKVRFSNGDHVVCTGSHRFWTESGWIDAKNVEGLAVFRQEDLSTLPEAVRGALAKDRIPFGPVLQPRVRNVRLDGKEAKRVLPRYTEEGSSGLADRKQSMEFRHPVQRRNAEETKRNNGCEGGQIHKFQGRERDGDDSLRGTYHGDFSSGLEMELPYTHKTVSRSWLGRITKQLQAGFRMAGAYAGFGVRRGIPHYPPRKVSRCEENQGVGSVRVDSVTVEERSGETTVYDIEVRDAHNYFANGILVHNCTKLKSFRLRQGGQRAAALGKVIHAHVKYFHGLTGSPAANGLKDLWGQCWMVDRGARLGRTFDAFSTRWFKPSPDGFGSVAMPHAESEIQELLKDICITIDSADYFDLEAPIITNIEIELPHKVRELYNEMEKNYYMELECGSSIEALNGAAKSMKLLQICSGAAYLDAEVDSDNHPKAREFRTLHDEKLDVLDDIMEETGGTPIMVAYTFKSDLARLQKKYPEGRWLSDDTQMEQFKSGKYQLGFAHAKSVGHGVDNLQRVCYTMVNFSQSWGLEENEQLLGRIGAVRQFQAGFKRNVFVYNLIARDTIDEVVAERLISKSTVQEALLQAMKRRKEQ